MVLSGRQVEVLLHKRYTLRCKANDDCRMQLSDNADSTRRPGIIESIAQRNCVVEKSLQLSNQALVYQLIARGVETLQQNLFSIIVQTLRNR